MIKLFLAAGVAALAIAAPASAERGEKGGGKKSQAAKAKQGGKAKARAAKRDNAKAYRSAQRGGGYKSEARKARRVDGPRYAVLERKQDRSDFKVRGDDRKVKIKAKDWDRKDRSERIVIRDRDDWRDRRADARRRASNDWCPPGLDAKDNGCMPPGQLKNRFAQNRYLGQRLPDKYSNALLPLSLRSRYVDSDNYYYRYGDGYAYRVDRKTNLVNSLLPLIAGGLGLGQAFPSAYSSFAMPSYYQPFYRDSGDDYYRYANGNVYEIDRSSGLIEGIVPLLAGGYGVGQMLPPSYSTYNLPYQYRDYYRDDDDYYYRYGPGSIYRVDRGSNLVDSVVALLANDLAVGQRLPMGYDVYNVPMAYRDRYYDSPEAMYRYNDGNIYRVDPTTQLITAIISAIV